MHPSVDPSLIYRWKQARRAAAFVRELGCGTGAPGEQGQHGYYGAEFGAGPEGGAFGVRRPLRFLGYKLGLSDSQVAEMARILNDLKTERAQAAVDDRRTLTALADAVCGESFDAALANQGADLRRKGAERLAEAVVTALGRIHKLLDPKQRERLAYLIRSGALAL